MYSQNMSEKIARSVCSNLRLESVVPVSHDKRLGSFDVQDKSVSHATSRYSSGKSTLPQWQYQWPTIGLAVLALSHIQQTPRNMRQFMAYSFSGATKL